MTWPSELRQTGASTKGENSTAMHHSATHRTVTSTEAKERRKTNKRFYVASITKIFLEMTWHHKQQQKIKQRKKNHQPTKQQRQTSSKCTNPTPNTMTNKVGKLHLIKIQSFFSVCETGPLLDVAVTTQGMQLLPHTTVKTHRSWKNICT